MHNRADPDAVKSVNRHLSDGTDSLFINPATPSLNRTVRLKRDGSRFSRQGAFAGMRGILDGDGGKSSSEKRNFSGKSPSTVYTIPNTGSRMQSKISYHEIGDW